MRILIVEDNEDLCEALSLVLTKEGYIIDCVHSGEDGLQFAMQNAHDLIVLDRMLPEKDGLTILKTIRKEKITTPVLMLTALNSVGDRVQGLDCGADDYLAKPFAMEELLARIRALIRRPNALNPDTEWLSCGDLRLDPEERTLYGPGGSCSLSKKEAEFFSLFFRSPGKPLSREVLIARIWGSYAPIEDGNLDNYIYFLRRRLKSVQSGAKIVTIRSAGYRFEVAP